jgi:4-hydroxy-3-methylbut-2-en-1-yl diphosphate synthase IspG/GcpE
MAIVKRKKEVVKIVSCPTCGRNHRPHDLYGQYCCLSCLQFVLRPLIVAINGALPKQKPNL